MKVVTALQLLGQSLFASAEVRDYARYRLAKEMARRIYPKYVFSEHGRIWLNDADFFRDYFSFMPANNGHSADRKYLLKNLMRLVEGIPGDSAECGVFEGASSFVMCQQIRGTRKRHHLFDSFAGLSAPKSIDGDHWLSVVADRPRADVAEAGLAGPACGFSVELPGRFLDARNHAAQRGKSSGKFLPNACSYL